MKQKVIVGSTFILLCVLIIVFFFFAYEKGQTEYALEKVSYDHPKSPAFEQIIIPPAPFRLSDNNLKIVKKRVRFGDSFYQIMRNLHIDNEKINQINNQISRKVDLSNFQKGDDYHVYYTEGSKAVKLDYPIDGYNYLRLDFERAIARIIAPEVMVTDKRIQGEIHGSLIASLAKKGAPEDLADKVVTIFAWDVDFRNLLAGDQFDIYYEENTVGGNIVGSGKINAIKLTHNNESHFAYFFDYDDNYGYFDNEGKNNSHGPVKGAIVTSLYSQKRLHPVRRTYRAHRGMDFMADEGTPVMAMDSGQVVAAKYHYGNGNYVKIQHAKGLMTQYLHLSEIDNAVKEGSFVGIGQVIGKVGNTGLSSGPHLCLRVWYKGKQRDPLKYKFPRRKDVPEVYKREFENHIAQFFQNIL